MRRSKLIACLTMAVALSGCADPQYDARTPQQALDSVRQMIDDGRLDLLPTMVHIEARDITYEDGVTEASAIEDVRDKMGDMLAQLWRVGRKLKERYPDDVQAELAAVRKEGQRRDFGEWFAKVLVDPFGFLDQQRQRIEVEDLYDGTAAVSVDGEPAFGGAMGMIETDDGWRFNIPIDMVQGTRYWPNTRHEWRVIAHMMLAIENSLADFEREIDEGQFSDLHEASARAGRLIGESVVAQSIIYGMMKERGDDPEADSK